MFINGVKATILINSEVTPEMGEELSDFIYGVRFMNQVRTIEVDICSGGGSVIAGYAIYSSLLQARQDGMQVITNCNGIAASIAGIIFLAGGIRNIRNYGLVMIHNPSGGDDKTLLKIKESLKEILSDSFKGNLDKLMNEETWYNANELSSMGIVSNIIETDFELPNDIVSTSSVQNLYEICNDILKNKQTEMKVKNTLATEEKVKVINAEEETATKEEPTPEETKDAEGDETTEEEAQEEITIEQLDERVTALEQMIQQLMEANASVIAENNAMKAKKEEEAKIEVLNKAGIEKKDFEKWMNLDVATITNLASTIKLTKVSPAIETKNAIQGLTQEVFNSMSKEDKEKLFKEDKTTYWKFFKNTK